MAAQRIGELIDGWEIRGGVEEPVNLKRAAISLHSDSYELWSKREFLMQIAKISARGQMTIPLSIRKAANLHAGDILAFAIKGDHVIVRNITCPAEGYLKGIEESLHDWDSPEDEVAWDAL